MDLDKANYIFRYYSQPLTDKEHLANRHLTATVKLTHGRDDPAAQAEAARKSDLHRKAFFSEDPEVLRLASEGYNAFIIQVAERVMREHPDRIFFNLCPQCGKLAKTPKAKQCRFCFHDWHDESQQNPNSSK